MTSMISYAQDACIHCGACTRVCPFLEHYDIDVSDFASRPELRGECYLCDHCKRHCPRDISGAGVAMEHRRKDPLPHFKLRLKKNPYLLRNLQKKNTKSLLFLGCNYPGQFPETCKKLIDLAAEDGIDFSVDCCKKPILQTGHPLDENTVFRSVRDRGIERLICCCPNCYSTFKKRAKDFEVISIFEYLEERGLLFDLTDDIPLYIPCGDRREGDFLRYLLPYLKNVSQPYRDILCCGLGGGSGHSPEIGDEIKRRFQAVNDEVGSIWTYCASCTIAFQRYELKGIANVLSAFLGIEEPPSDAYLKNVLRFKRYPHGK